MLEKNKIATSLSKLAIVRAAFAFLNLGDDGKIESFINRVIRKLSTEVKILKQNLTQKEFIYEQEKETLTEKLEDAEVACEHALIDINVALIATNEAQEKYSETYIDNIDNKYLAAASIKEKLTKLDEVYAKDVEDLNKEIASLEKRINILSATV
jgi:hypothetical protein